MSVLSVDSVIKPLTSCFNVGMNLLTKQFYLSLNPQQSEYDRGVKAAKFNYDLKVTLYNLASVYAIYKAVCMVFVFSSPLPTLKTIGILLLVRKVIDSSMSATASVKSTFENLLNPLKGQKSIASLSVTDHALSSVLAAMKMTFMVQGGWNEEMIQISGVTIFKNWHLTIPGIIKHFGIA